MSIYQQVSQATTNNAINDPHLVQFKSNSTTCAMFTKSCKIEIILNKNMNLNSLQVNPYKTKIYKFLRLQLCQNKSSKDDCNVKINDENNIELNIAYIYIDAITVGRSQLFLNYNFTNEDLVINGKINHEDNISDNADTRDSNVTVMELTTSYYLKHEIIISSPQRLLDKIHMVYVIIFQTIVSIFMGLLIDVTTIVKIIKMPLPVVIGFVSQYILMPLVCYILIIMFQYIIVL